MARLLLSLTALLTSLLEKAAWAATEAGGVEWKNVDLGPMQGGDQFSSPTMVAAAYAFIWVMVLLFVASIWLRSKRIQRELDDLGRAITNRPAATRKE